MNSVGQPGRAEESARVGLMYDPCDHDCLCALGTAYIAQGLWVEAKNAFDRCLQIRPGKSSALWNRAHANLALENWRQGFDDYMYGYSVGTRRSHCPYRHWQGDEIPGQTLLLYGEQGIGDVIQFARFVPLARERSKATIIVEVRPELLSMLSDLGDAAYCQTTDGALPYGFDRHASFASLPYLLGLDSVDPSPYVGVPDHIPGDTKGRTIGFAWAGSRSNPNDQNRSLTLEQAKRFEKWQPLMGSLQPLEDQPFGMPDLTGIDMLGTAAVVKNLELVVCTDTSIAHVAGAIGAECWVMEPIGSEYRWGTGSHSPWYSSVRVFRSRNGRDAQITEVLNALDERYTQ